VPDAEDVRKMNKEALREQIKKQQRLRSLAVQKNLPRPQIINEKCFNVDRYILKIIISVFECYLF